jgi:hypothetical protein
MNYHKLIGIAEPIRAENLNAVGCYPDHKEINE